MIDKRSIRWLKHDSSKQRNNIIHSIKIIGLKMIQMIAAWLYERRFILSLLLTLLAIRLAFFYIFPVDLWNSSDDYPIHSLAHAVHIDQRLHGDSSIKIGYAQTAHPGIIFQTVSWIVYRVSNLFVYGTAETRLIDVLSDSVTYWRINQIVPLLIFSLVFLFL